MTRSALYLSIAASVAALALGWGLGVVTGSHVNTMAARAYTNSMSIRLLTQYGDLSKSCEERLRVTP